MSRSRPPKCRRGRNCGVCMMCPQKPRRRRLAERCTVDPHEDDEPEFGEPVTPPPKWTPYAPLPELPA